MASSVEVFIGVIGDIVRNSLGNERFEDQTA